mgnify:CR=1 FL=1
MENGEAMGKLAIKGGTPVRTKGFLPWPIYDEREIKAVEEVIRSRHWWRYSGKKVTEFEEKFAKYHNAKYGVAVTSGTTALEIALKAADIGPGDEVIVPPYTFLATASSVLLVNAIPIFVDIDSETYNINPTRIEEAITNKTKAIIPVHFGGYPADMDRIIRIARKHNLVVIEDAAHAHGAIWKGKKVGAIGDMGTFSFQESKNISSGEGGIVLTNDKDLAEKCFSLMSFGRMKGGLFYTHHILGWNYRMTEFQGAILGAQLERLEEQTNRREKNANYLSEHLRGIKGLSLLKRDDPRVTRRAYHIYIFKYDKSSFNGVPRERFIEALKGEGIPCASGYPIPLYKNPMFLEKKFWHRGCPLSCPFYGKELDYSKVNCPVAEKACYEEAVFLTQNLLLGTKEDMKNIVRAIKKVVGNIDEL